MRGVIQRVSQAGVTTEGHVSGRIDTGLVIFLGVEEGDTDQDVNYMADKTANLRVFSDAAGKMNMSVKDIDGQVLVVSQFTLLGDCRKGRRPSFGRAAAPQQANTLYERFIDRMRHNGVKTETGVFRATMQVELVNNGPVTLLLDSKGEL